MIQMELRLPYVPEKCIAFKFDRKNFEVVYVHHDKSFEECSQKKAIKYYLHNWLKFSTGFIY